MLEPQDAHREVNPLIPSPDNSSLARALRSWERNSQVRADGRPDGDVFQIHLRPRFWKCDANEMVPHLSVPLGPVRARTAPRR